MRGRFAPGCSRSPAYDRIGRMTALQMHPLYQEDLDRILESGFAESLSGRRVAVTGASGLIGTVLVDALLRANAAGAGIRVAAIARNRERLEERFGGRLSDPPLRLVEQVVRESLPEDLDFDIGIAAASNTSPLDYAAHPVATALTNLEGARHMLDAAVRCGGRVLFCSSVEVYGNARDDRSFREEDTGILNLGNARASYPESKRAGEALCQCYRTEFGVPVNSARICRVFGPTVLPGDTKAASQFIDNAVRGEDIVLKSEGTQFYSWIHVADCVSALLAILAHGEDGLAYNVAADNCNASLRDFARCAADAAGTKLVFDLPNEAERRGYSKTTRAVLDVSRLGSLGWRPAYDLAGGIARTIAVLKETA